MAAEELDTMDVITKLSNQALQEYEGLQRKHETAAMECKRLEGERDEAIKKLNEFQQVSQMVIEEVSAIQENLEIERTCRESAEALASKLNRQNRSLKRKSMMLLPHLSPETITEINLEVDEEEEEEEEEESEELHAASKVCLSPQSQTTFSELQNKLEKHQAVPDLEAVREQLRETREELLKEKHDNTGLIAETVRQKKLLGKYNRVSQFAVGEYEALQDTFNLERDLRTEAESFARAMLVEQKKLKRQSQILMQSSSPSQALQEALGQVTRLTQDLETQRLEYQNQIKQMEDRLMSCEAQRELTALRHELELLEEEKREYSDKCSRAETEVKDLRFTVEELQKKLQAATNPHPAPAPPPPPPPPPLPPPPPPATASNPLSSLLSLIRKRRDINTDIPLVVQDSAKTPEVDIRHQAVEEMMHRIKKGVQLRRVGQSPNRTRRQMERLPSNSAIQELKGIMENFSRTPPQPKAVSPTTNRDEELQKILLRRRDAVESQHDASKFHLLHFRRHIPGLHPILSPAV
ncbi:shootin-1 isoform X1 [Sebastes umbrosus]|uniref:shootin-1 isoform X1 n=1 Tax=Sebastes umbrosus TaxID=72105 RepID=UPI0018A015BF|nr:shootin-1 isoform X1 [Sebastes umbrosus]